MDNGSFFFFLNFWIFEQNGGEKRTGWRTGYTGAEPRRVPKRRRPVGVQLSDNGQRSTRIEEGALRLPPRWCWYHQNEQLSDQCPPAQTIVAWNYRGIITGYFCSCSFFRAVEALRAVSEQFWGSYRGIVMFYQCSFWYRAVSEQS